MAELADATALGAVSRKAVEVRVLFRAPSLESASHLTFRNFHGAGVWNMKRIKIPRRIYRDILKAGGPRFLPYFAGA